jgi:glycosyltransferase involved in cell wall biosynthesis
MASVEVLEVRHQYPANSRPRGCHIDLPRPGRADGPTVEFCGWALGQDGPALAVELTCAGAVVRRLPVNHPRPDLAAAFPDVPGAAVAGFRGFVPTPAGIGEQDFKLRAVLPGQARVPIGAVRLRRAGTEAGPLVSVVIPCHRQARFLAEAVESALAQEHGPMEVVVVDDGSPDATAAVASRYPGVRYLRQANAGLSAARNAGLRVCTGEFVVFLDADDRLLPNAVAASLACFREHPDCAFVSGRYHRIASDGSLIWTSGKHVIVQDHYLELLRWNYVGMHAAVMYRRAVVETLGGFDPGLGSCEDYDLYLRIAREHPLACHGQVVAEYRQHDANMSRRCDRMLRFALAVLHAQRRHLRDDRGRWQAYRLGVRRWRRIYGEMLLAELQAGGRSWRERARALVAILRLDPRRAPAALELWTHRSTDENTCGRLV